jgi:putative flippase GtrA
VSQEETLAAAPPAVAPPVHLRVRRGMRRAHNWVELVRFLVVGASGTAVNLVTFAILVEGLGLHHLPGATIAFLLAVTNNFWWNRHWTFGAADGLKRFQAPRFLLVSVTAFGFATAVLHTLVTVGVPEVIAQAMSIAAATPLNFIGNKMWSFGRAGVRT